MTLGRAAAGVVATGGGTYNIGFNEDDETQFDAYDLAELLDLWIEFCAENNFNTSSVDYVEKVMGVMELLSRTIAKEYQRAASVLADEGLQDIGQRRTLRIELQKRCGLTELEAVNVINGHHVQDYIAKYERRQE